MAEVTQADREAANAIAEIIREEENAVWHGAIERVLARHRTEAVKPLVEALEKAIQTLEVYADPTGYYDAFGEQLPADATDHEGRLAQIALDEIAALRSVQS